jgi:coenzyme F420-reducing hydrogenase beta subunit
MKLFLNNLNINTSCLNCQFNDFPRVADITLGDFWGVDNYDKSLNNNKGLSVIIINSDKGQSVFNNIQDMSQEVPINVVVQYNPNIVTPSKPHKKRKEFFKDIKKGKSLSYCAKRYCKDTIPFYVKFASYLPEPIKIFIKSVLKIS